MVPAALVPTWNLFGLSIEAVGYQGTVLPVLVMSFFLAKLETSLHKITPSWLDNLTTPLISILVCGFVTFLRSDQSCAPRQPVGLRVSWLYLAGFIGGRFVRFVLRSDRFNRHAPQLHRD